LSFLSSIRRKRPFLSSIRRKRLARAPVLVGLVLGLDLLWALAAGSTGAISYALLDVPAHLLTCVVGLLVLAALWGRAPAVRFTAAAAAASVLIDLDHLPGYLGSHLLTGSSPRPYSHSLALVLLLVLAAACSQRAAVRQVCLGLGFGVALHLFRDLATGPGVPLLWPLSDATIRMPYAVYATLLCLPLIAFLPRHRLTFSRAAASLAVAAVAVSLLGASVAGARVIAMGTYVRGAEESPGLIDRYTEEVGRAPAIIGSFKRWDVRPFEASELSESSSRGAVPMVSWEPWDSAGHGFRLAAIAHGRYDDFLRRSAREAEEWGGPILLRFGQEMNGSWAPWQRGVDGTTGPRFIAAWRHMVRLFHRVGADNVYWVWCPYVSNGRNRFMGFYPGDRWVDWIALDGYNWGSPKPWQSFSKIFDRSYRQLAAVAPRKPFMIAEIGSNEAGGNKASWLRTALGRQLPRLRRINAVVWFDATDGADFRVDSSPAALEAFRSVVDRRLYSGTGSWVARLSRRGG
jgi:membrane-bound metal-dependent hydrolase YbcI (DUF457 family)